MLPLGIKFLPSHDEIIYYLKQVNSGNLQDDMGIFHLVDLYKSSPWDLPMNYKHGCNREAPRMYYITERRRVNNSGRVSRSAGDGHWHGQGGAKAIKVGSEVVGHVEQFQFKTGKGKFNNGTNWIMHEYALPSPDQIKEFQKWTICVLHQKKDRRKLLERRLPVLETSTSTSTAAGVDMAGPSSYDHNDQLTKYSTVLDQPVLQICTSFDQLITNSTTVVEDQPVLQICSSAAAPAPPAQAALLIAPNMISEEAAVLRDYWERLLSASLTAPGRL